MSKPRLYLAGKMRGIEDFNFPAFDFAAAELRTAGYEVVSPAEIDREHGITAETTISDELMAQLALRDAKAISECDGIALIAGWLTSTGTQAEIAFARFLDMEVAEVDTWLRRARDDDFRRDHLKGEEDAKA